MSSTGLHDADGEENAREIARTRRLRETGHDMAHSADESVIVLDQHSDEDMRRDAETCDVLAQAARALMEDVREELSTCDALLQHARLFREQHHEQYAVANVSVSLREIIVMYITLDVVPIVHLSRGVTAQHQHQNQQHHAAAERFYVEARDWFAPLRMFAIDEEDKDFMRKIICASAVPWTLSVIEEALDPVLATSCALCSGLVSELRSYMGERETQRLQTTVCRRFDEALVTDMCLPWMEYEASQPASMQSKLFSDRMTAFSLHQMARLTNVLRNLIT